jgi:hypothetical protein
MEDGLRPGEAAHCRYLIDRTHPIDRAHEGIEFRGSIRDPGRAPHDAQDAGACVTTSRERRCCPVELHLPDLDLGDKLADA